MTNTTNKPAIVYVVERQRKDKGPWAPISMTTTKKSSKVEHTRRLSQHHAYFPDGDEESSKEKMAKLQEAALKGCELAKRSLREMPQPLRRWFRAGIGEVI